MGETSNAVSELRITVAVAMETANEHLRTMALAADRMAVAAEKLARCVSPGSCGGRLEDPVFRVTKGGQD